MNRLLLASIAINLLAFAQMATDKHRATKGRRRISEAQLLVPVLFSGIIGVVTGMLVFHHKTAKRSFQIKLAIALALFLGLAWFLFKS
jgi:uncharacterized membrane protein YsdA (DUF1294 family)